MGDRPMASSAEKAASTTAATADQLCNVLTSSGRGLASRRAPSHAGPGVDREGGQTFVTRPTPREGDQRGVGGKRRHHEEHGTNDNNDPYSTRELTSPHSNDSRGDGEHHDQELGEVVWIVGRRKHGQRGDDGKRDRDSRCAWTWRKDAGRRCFGQAARQTDRRPASWRLFVAGLAAWIGDVNRHVSLQPGLCMLGQLLSTDGANGRNGPARL